MERLTSCVEHRIENILPPLLALFSCLKPYRYSLFGSICCLQRKKAKDVCQCKSVLFSLSQLLNETTLDSAYHAKTIKNILSVYVQSWEKVVPLTDDNVPTNISSAALVSLPLIGCASHMLQHARQNIAKRHQQTVLVVHKFMVKLSTLKMLQN